VGAGDLFEEGEELGMGVPGAAVLGGDLAGGDLQRGEQGGGAVADVVVAGLLRQSGPQRQDRRGAIQRLDLRLFVDADNDGLVRRVEVKPDDIADLGFQFRSVENVNVSRRHGCSFHSRQIRATCPKEIPRHRPSSRADQCVTPSDSGGGFSVPTTTATSSTVAGRPDRFRSPSAAIPPDSYRLRHKITVGRDTPTRRPISAFGTPSAASSTIRARCAKPTSTVDDRTSAVNLALSPGRRINATATDIPHCLETPP
jgi:hypothetical protein